VLAPFVIIEVLEQEFVIAGLGNQNKWHPIGFQFVNK